MARKDQDFLKKLLATFRVEAAEHLEAMTSGLLALEKASDAEKESEIIETVFREAHSLKGAARAVNQNEIEAVCQSLEGIFSTWKRSGVVRSPELFDLIHQASDSARKLLLSVETGPSPSEKGQIGQILRRLENASKGTGDRGSPQLRPTIPDSHPLGPALEETVRISTAKLDSLLLQAEELLSAKLAASQRASQLHEILGLLVDLKKEWGKNSEFLERGDNRIASVESKLTNLSRLLDQDHRTLGRMVDDLLGDMKKVLMLPFSVVSELFPRLVRDLSRDQGKEVELAIQGAQIEIDRRILEELKDPLIHLVRNCIDHGIEKPEERTRKKKPPQGTIAIGVSQKNGGKVELLVSDDGAGIDTLKVKDAAIRLGLLSPDQAGKLNDQELLSFIFKSGVSTSPIITDVSGRGLGLAIVREKVEKLGGAVSVETRPDTGTAFRLTLPLTLATFRGALVKAAERLFIIPTTYVERAVRVKKEEIQTTENRETIQLNGRVVSLVRLADVLELARKKPDDVQDQARAVILTSGGAQIAMLVDEILSEQEVLVKPLGKQLSRVRDISGATVLSTGEVVPIINVLDLMQSAVRVTGPTVERAVAPAKEEGRQKSVLVVEDSITARSLLKNILEAAGYEVRTAVDGVDALMQLRTDAFDIVVSDVDMPRMNGFDLTARIRGDKKLAELPVVLVTALESREDRERGIDAGANAYIVKSSFDQSNLLEVIGRLI